MIGAIIGDVVGSVYEFQKTTDPNFPLFKSDSEFTDDTILTIAVADAILNKATSYLSYVHQYAQNYDSSYGGSFRYWIREPVPYNSFGNGSAMRVSPVAFAFDDLETVLKEAEKTAIISHNHPEGIKGAQVTAAAVFLARTGASKDEIRQYIETTFGYAVSRSYAEAAHNYAYNETCQRCVPEAIISFLESHDFESTIRNAVLLGGDADTLAAIAGPIAQAFYKEIPKLMYDKTLLRLRRNFIEVLNEFEKTYSISYILIE